LILTTRSGLAPGRRTVGWAIIALTYPYHYFASTTENPIEFGDKFWGNLYCHYFNPFTLKRSAQKIGLHLIDFNSEESIANNKRPSFLTNFSKDRSLFYVFQK